MFSDRVLNNDPDIDTHNGCLYVHLMTNMKIQVYTFLKDSFLFCHNQNLIIKNLIN